MGTNYYFISRNKELMQTYFAEKSEWGVLGEEYTIVDEPYLGYRCHLNKLSCGWRPLFRKRSITSTLTNARPLTWPAVLASPVCGFCLAASVTMEADLPEMTGRFDPDILEAQ